jgi:hypothetical protein
LRMFKKLALIAVSALALLLTACNFAPNFGGQPTEEVAEITPSATLTATPPTLAPTLGQFNTLSPPTLTAGPTSAGGPTPLPAPTQIGAATATQISGDNTGTPGTPGTPSGSETPRPTSVSSLSNGIRMDPQLGEPLEVVIVTGADFTPGEMITFHWGGANPNDPTGPDYYEMEADASGNFSVGLKVPPKEKWPGGNPKENDLLQLRVTAESLGFNYYWANFKYVKRIDYGSSLVQVCSIPSWDYEVGLPNLWRWEWPTDDDGTEHTENVRFLQPDGAERGFIRVIETTNVDSAIASVMSAEGLTVASKAVKTLGTFPNSTEVTTTNGRIVWFISARSRVYAIHFRDNNGFITVIGNSFKVK